MYNRACILPATGGGAFLAGFLYHRFTNAVAGILLVLLVLTIIRTLAGKRRLQAPPSGWGD
ncbi:MAG: hypothetical protein ACM3X6_01040 [Patescibacteria group bacterium]